MPHFSCGRIYYTLSRRKNQMFYRGICKNYCVNWGIVKNNCLIALKRLTLRNIMSYAICARKFAVELNMKENDAYNNKERTFVPVGRFAPTPSGELHAGNVLCALIAYLSVKSRGGRFLLRIEDLDAVRCPKVSAQKILDILGAFGLDGDEPPLRQSERGGVYRAKEEILRSKNLVYPCFCTRAQLHASEAPRLGDGGVVYSGVCRSLTEEQAAEKAKMRKPCLRVAVPDSDITFHDGIAGVFTQNLSRECGDFIIRRSDGVYAYQLAVSVDDGESGVTEVVRGADLLSSTPRQIWLMNLLGYNTPKYYHIPLVCDPFGRKLSKSEGDGIAHRLAVSSPERLLGSLAYAAHIIPADVPASLPELTGAFSWEKIPKTRILLPQSLM